MCLYIKHFYYLKNKLKTNYNLLWKNTLIDFFCFIPQRAMTKWGMEYLEAFDIPRGVETKLSSIRQRQHHQQIQPEKNYFDV